MFADDKSIENFQQLFFEFKKYLELQKEYTKLELTEKLTILFSTLIMILVLIILGMVRSIGRRSCYHCTDAGCVKACSSGALSKDERGVVKLDTDKCNGCTFCQAACPFDVPRFRPMDGRIDKCTLCIDRLDNGGIPACVKTCQPEALRFGPREEMLKKAHERVEFLKKKGFTKAEVYGENECGGLHVIHVCAYGHEAYGLPTDPKPKAVLNGIDIIKPVTAVGTAAVIGALAVSFLANLGYRRKEVTLEEAKAHWTPEQRALAEREAREALKKVQSGKDAH